MSFYHGYYSCTFPLPDHNQWIDPPVLNDSSLPSCRPVELDNTAGVPQDLNLVIDQPRSSGHPGHNETQWLAQATRAMRHFQPSSPAPSTSCLDAQPSVQGCIDPRVLHFVAPSIATPDYVEPHSRTSVGPSAPQMQPQPRMSSHGSSMSLAVASHETAATCGPLGHRPRLSGASRTRRPARASRSAKPYDVVASAPRRTTRSMASAASFSSWSPTWSSSEASSSAGPSTPGHTTPYMEHPHVVKYGPTNGCMGHAGHSPEISNPPVLPSEATDSAFEERAPKRRRLAATSCAGLEGKERQTSPIQEAASLPQQHGDAQPAQVECQLVDPSTGVVCGASVTRGDEEAIEKHLATHTGPNGNLRALMTRLIAPTSGKLTTFLRCTWLHCTKQHVEMSLQSWERHVATLETHFALLYMCPIHDDTEKCKPKRKDSMRRHVKGVHIAHGAVLPPTWADELQPFIG
ncbi:hypothetical protein OBBRIDRAFT_838281 [Obba rivulosa]|uniref:Uncharacterized protein n=1 Tax=Obba rivulosa TaxID=1052685 RepID=A0A8E2AQ34_9APHY|nr:hypothetical protein OBBRIDRAFT_838281 [Obba rivulosa]